MLWQGGVVGDVVDHRGSIGLGVYRREEGEETINIRQTKHQKNITRQYAVLGVPYAVGGDTSEGGKTSGKVFPVFRVFGQRNRRGKFASSIC